MHQAGHVKRTFLFLSVGLLMGVSFVPFPSRLVAERIQDDGAQAAALACGIALTATATFFNALWLYASRPGRLLRPDADPRVVTGITRSHLPRPFIYLGATLVALVNAGLGIALFVVFAIGHVVDSALFGNGDERDADDDEGANDEEGATGAWAATRPVSQ